MSIFCQKINKKTLQYYKLRHEAIKNLCEEKYDSAILNYRNAFKKKSALPYDVLNFVKLKILTKNVDLVETKQLLKKTPYALALLLIDSLILNNQETYQYLSTYPPVAPSIFDTFIEGLFDNDQMVRANCTERNGRCNETIKQADSANMKALSAALKMLGPLTLNASHETLFRIAVIALHARSVGILGIDSIMNVAVRSGIVDNHYYMYYSNQTSIDSAINKNVLNKIPALQYDNEFVKFADTIIHFKITEDYRNKADVARSHWLLPTISSDGVRIKTINNPNSPFYRSVYGLGYLSNRYPFGKEWLNNRLEKWKKYNMLVE